MYVYQYHSEHYEVEGWLQIWFERSGFVGCHCAMLSMAVATDRLDSCCMKLSGLLL